MINIQNKIDCCGCNACGDVCAHQAITFKTDIEGFWYPEVDKDKCTDCHLCEKVCPIINIKDLKKNDYPKPSHTIAAIHKNMRVRWNSTSGGAYTALAEAMLEQGGYISGAVYNEGFTGVHNYVTNNPKDLDQLRSSKYLQSNAEGIFKQIKQLLTKGEKVLACGTPCQMAALRSFLRKDYDNLIIVDFVCRGVNSPKIYRAYLDSLERKYASKVIYVKAKNKELGWRNLTRKVTFANGKSYYGVKMDDDFRRGYHTNVFCRPSCYDCKFKEFPRIADITIADFWGIEKVDSNLDNDLGTSMILLNSKKGELFFDLCKEKLEFKETDLSIALAGNIALTKSIPASTIDRKSLFTDLESSDFETITKKYFPPIHTRDGVRSTIKSILGTIMFYRRMLGLTPNHWYNFIKLNLRHNTKCNIRDKKVLIPRKDVVFDINPEAKIIIDAPIVYGHKPVRGLSVPTCLRMEAGTTFHVHSGPLDRYGNVPYNLRYGAYIEIVNGGILTIGDGAANVGLTIMCAKEVTIGDGVRIGRDVSIRDWNGPHVIISDTYKTHAPVHIANHVWLCTGCTIMPGVTVGEGAVVAGHAVVTKNVPPHSLVAGNPARVIKENIQWY